MRTYVILLPVFCFSSALVAAPGGLSPTISLEETSSTAHATMGSLGQTRDVGQMYFNPAALYNPIKGRNFSVTFQSSSQDFQQVYGFLGYAWPGKEGTNKYAIGLSYLGNSNLRQFDSSGNFTQSFSAIETLVGGSHMWAVSDQLQFGETLKLFYFNYNVAIATAIGVDLGAVYSPFRFLSLGFSLDNLISSNVTFATESEPLPASVKFQPTISFFRNKVRLHYQMTYYLGLFEDYSLPFEHQAGFEFDIYKRYISARAGYNGENVTVGIGSFIKPYQISFGYFPTAFETRFAGTISFNLDSSGIGPFARPDLVSSNDVEEELSDFYTGMEFYVNKDFKKAYDKFTNVVELNPDHKIAKEYQKRALLHLKSNDWLDEEERKLIELNKKLAKKYESKKNYGDAINEWREVLKINPADNDANFNIKRIKDYVRNRVITYHKTGLNSYASNDRLTAIDNFNKALRLNPEYEPSKTWLFKIKQEISQEELREIEKIERQQKAELYYKRGLSFLGRKKYDEAITNFEKTLALNPEHENSKKYLKIAKEDKDLDRKGLRGLSAAKELYAKGMKNMREERYYYAMKDFTVSIRAKPDYSPSIQKKKEAEIKLDQQTKPLIIDGRSAYRKKRFTAAKEKFTSVLRFDPLNKSAEEFLQKIRNEHSTTLQFNFDEGRKYYKKARRSGKIKTYSRAISHLDEVVSGIQDSDAKPDERKMKYEADSLLKKARQQVKSRVDRLHAKAKRAYDVGKLDDAIDGWESVLVVDPANLLAKRYLAEAERKRNTLKSNKKVKVWLSQGISYYQNRDYERSLVLMGKVLKVDSNNRKAKRYKKKCLEAIDREKQQDKISALFIDGVKLFKRRKYDRAIKKWKKVKKMDPENPLIDKYIAQAIQDKKNRKKIDFINGKKYYKNGQWLQALSSFTRAIREDPKNRKVREMIQLTKEHIQEEKQQLVSEGDKLLRASKYKEALVQYKQAERLEKTADVQDKHDKALLAFKKKKKGNEYFESETKLGLSIDAYLKVLEVNPFDKEAGTRIIEAKEKGKSRINEWFSLADQAANKNKFKLAYSYYNSVKAIDPSNKKALKGAYRMRRKLREKVSRPYQEGKEAMALKNYKLAIERFKYTLEVYEEGYEDSKALLAKARSLRVAQVRTARSTASSGTTKNDLRIINLGIKLYRQRKYKEAIATWRRISKKSEAYSKVQKYIARAKLKL